jgi:hypothetical protein
LKVRLIKDDENRPEYRVENAREGTALAVLFSRSALIGRADFVTFI